MKKNTILWLWYVMKFLLSQATCGSKLVWSNCKFCDHILENAEALHKRRDDVAISCYNYWRPNSIPHISTQTKIVLSLKQSMRSINRKLCCIKNKWIMGIFWEEFKRNYEKYIKSANHTKTYFICCALCALCAEKTSTRTGLNPLCLHLIFQWTIDRS